MLINNVTVLFRLVSHTTDDMVFQWDPDVPLVVDEHIELPQLALVKNVTADCELRSHFRKFNFMS